MGRLSADPDRRLGAIDLVKELGCEPMALAQACAVITSSAWTLPRLPGCVRAQAGADDGASPAGRSRPRPSPGRSASSRPNGCHPRYPRSPCWPWSRSWTATAFPPWSSRPPPPATTWPATVPAAVPTGRAPAGALLVLERAGLLTIDRTTAPPMVRMSPVLQSALRTMMPEGMLEHAARAAADALTEAWPREDQTGWLAESFRSCTASLSQAAGDLLWAGGCHPVLQRAGQSLDDARLTGSAADYWRDLASVSERLLGADHPHTMAAVQRLTGPTWRRAAPPTPSGGSSGWWTAGPVPSVLTTATCSRPGVTWGTPSSPRASSTTRYRAGPGGRRLRAPVRPGSHRHPRRTR